jgi:hypothetical protein
MALTTCKECGKEISDRAKICSQCVFPLRFEVGCGTLFLVLLFSVVLLYSGCKEMIKN